MTIGSALKIALIVAVSGPLVFIAVYSRLTRWACWRDPVGFTLVLEAIFAAGALAPLLLAEFFHLSTLGNVIGSWVLVGFFFAGGVTAYWRSLVFARISRAGKKRAGERLPLAGGDTAEELAP